jgi:hypothetical protein
MAITEQPTRSTESDAGAEALFKEARRRERRRRLVVALAVSVLVAGAGVGAFLTVGGATGSGLSHGVRPPAQSASVLSGRQFLYSTFRISYEVPNAPGAGATATASVKMWADTSSQACTASTFASIQSESLIDQDALIYRAGLPVGPRAPQPSVRCMNQNIFLGNGGQLGVGVMNVSSLPTGPAALARDIETARTGNPALNQSFEQAAPTNEPKGGPEYDKAFERASLLLIGPTVGATPEFREALLNALPTIPGVRSLGETSTSSGRTGLGFSAKNILGTTTVVVDPQTGALLEARNTDDDAFILAPQVNVDIQWLDPTGTPKVVGHGSLPPGAILRSPPNQAVNVTFKAEATFRKQNALLMPLDRDLVGLSSSGDELHTQIDFNGTRQQQRALAAALRKSHLVSKVTLGP